MEWEFTAEELVKGDIAYGLEEFRRDLAMEVNANLPPMSEQAQARCYGAIYDLCYWRATGRSEADFIATLQDEPEIIRLVKMVGPYMEQNVTMLGAILQRMIMDQVETGVPLAEAVAAADRVHQAVVGRDPVPMTQGGMPPA